VISLPLPAGEVWTPLAGDYQSLAVNGSGAPTPVSNAQLQPANFAKVDRNSPARVFVAPMVGYRNCRTFHIVWLDPDFSVDRHS